MILKYIQGKNTIFLELKYKTKFNCNNFGYTSALFIHISISTKMIIKKFILFCLVCCDKNVATNLIFTYLFITLGL